MDALFRSRYKNILLGSLFNSFLMKPFQEFYWVMPSCYWFTANFAALQENLLTIFAYLKLMKLIIPETGILPDIGRFVLKTAEEEMWD